MFLQVQTAPLPTPPSMPALEGFIQSFQAHPVIGIIATLAFILVFLVMFKFSDILQFFKDRSTKKQELEAKKLDLEAKKVESDEKRHDDMMKALDNMNKVVDNNTTAINSVEKSILISDAKMAERFSSISKDLLGMEQRIHDRISSSAKDAAHGSKLDKIADRLSRADSGGEDSDDGDSK